MAQRIHESTPVTDVFSRYGQPVAETIFQSIAIPLLLVDDRLEVLAMNSGCSSALSIDPEKATGTSFNEFVHPDHREDMAHLLQALRRDRQYWIGEFSLCDSWNKSFRSELFMQRIECSGRRVYFIALDNAWSRASTGSALNAKFSAEQAEEALRQVIRSVEPQGNGHLESRSQFESFFETQQPAWGSWAGWSAASTASEPQANQDLLSLTPTEMEICSYIRSGQSTKEIADLTHSSFETIQTHRKNIRKKMGLNGSKTALCTYLRMRNDIPAFQEYKALSGKQKEHK
jgi:DNA-binding CsgD family transcriptional regulator